MMSTTNQSNPEFSHDSSGGRIKGVCVVKPIVYGNIARYFGEKRPEDDHTHQWTVYVKPYNNEDMSAYVKKVHFKLHESYGNQNRVVLKPPYEITETGWGEFEIVIKIYFHDTNERPITLYHGLKLYQSGILSKNTVVSEFYEEIVFQDPTAFMHHLLTMIHPITSGVWKHETDFEEKKKLTLEYITNGKTKVRERINELREKLKLAKETIARFKYEIEKSKNGIEEMSP